MTPQMEIFGEPPDEEIAGVKSQMCPQANSAMFCFCNNNRKENWNIHHILGNGRHVLGHTFSKQSLMSLANCNKNQQEEKEQ